MLSMLPLRLAVVSFLQLLRKFIQFQSPQSVVSPGFVVRGTKMEIMSWGTHDGLQGRLQQLLDD